MSLLRLLSLLLLTLSAALPARALDPLPPGILRALMPEGMEARSTALLITGPDGWTEAHQARADRLLRVHTMVIGIDGPGLIALNGGCAQVAAPLADTVRRLQDQRGALPRAPMLTALPDTADLALSLASAAPARFKGLLTEGFGTTPPLCPGVTLGSKAPLRWYDIAATNQQPGQTSPASALPGTRMVAATEDPTDAFVDSYLRIAGTDSSFDVTTGTAFAELSDLPLTLHIDPQAPQTDTYAIFLSGDGGWARFDEEVSTLLAARGIPVVGISTLRYLWSEKSPEVIAADLARIDRLHAPALGRKRLLLLGFSLGANTLPFAAADLPDDLRARLGGVGLIAPEAQTGFEIKAGGWLGRSTGAAEVAPAIARLAQANPDLTIACLHGTRESQSACPPAQTLTPHLAATAFDGGHHLGNDHAAIVATLMGAMGFGRATSTMPTRPKTQ
ncbi:AcvB/VirJ family lysyl-phosphatidylglycerol hydrolase [Sagittula sp. S175]|uniref:AcvB/VirJ family lysyl-phosphatidylglycerol hydrolase n=1 Tax=Sagittula sp. S175 TaxID=3415129 RepID=UPI003C7CA8A5